MGLKITVTGRVQGVFFRNYTMLKAKELGLVGFVCNREDGTVYTEVEGQEDLLNKFVEWLQVGSPLSKVSAVDAVKLEPMNFTNFEIR
jgi:acylphosphatase